VKFFGFIIQTACVLIAASILGNWFLAEFKKLKAAGKQWYAVYLTPPGLLVAAIIILLPLYFGLQ
jgi:hypothetical protein